MISKLSTMVLLCLCLATPVVAAPIRVKGKLVAADETSPNGYTVLLVQKSGATKSSVVNAQGGFSFSVKKAQLANASLQLINADGRFSGPVTIAKKGTKVSTTFSGKASGATLNLGSLALYSDYAKVRRKLDSSVYSRPRVAADSLGKPRGAGSLGLVSTTAGQSLRLRAADVATDQGADPDLDGIPSSIDADDDGDLILDASDPDSEGLDVPYTGLFLDFRKTLNANVRSGLTDAAIDAVIGGENAFSLTFFFSLPNDSAIDGGFVVCEDALSYCRPNTPLGYYGGISESSAEFRGHPWSELLTSAGYPRMEKITLNGGSQAIAASIQPRVGRDEFRPGDMYRVALTTGDTETSSRTLALSPYFVSIPAIKEYDAGFGTVTVDYNAVDATSGSIPGVSPGDPIVLSGTGDLTLTFWRPQRAAIASTESGYYDWGNLHYGVIVGETQATCGGFYTGVSSELTPDSTYLGTGDSPLANQGANMSPYTDSQGDRAANSANTLTMTVNLKNCLSRAGSAPGTYLVNLRVVGEDLTGGQNAATQNLYVTIP